MLRHALVSILASAPLSAQLGSVLGEQKISTLEGGFGAGLDPSDGLGWSAAPLGDLDGDGIIDLAVSTPSGDDGGTSQGAVWILFLRVDGTVRAKQKISALAGGFNGNLDPGDGFGDSLCGLGDLDGDGVEDLAVGASADDDGTVDRGAIWILFLNANGTVKSHQKISEDQGWPGNHLATRDFFGTSCAPLGDLDGDGLTDLAVGATFDDDGNLNQGAVWVLFLNANGTVKDHQKISETAGGFTGVLDPDDRFGSALASPGDLDGDGLPDLAVGASLDDDGPSGGSGAVWILFLDVDGRVKSHQKISPTAGGFTGTLERNDNFGFALELAGDLDGNGVGDLFVGAPLSSDGATHAGSLWLLLLNSDGTVRRNRKISATEGGFGGSLSESDQFGVSLANLGDLDGNGIVDLAVGANLDDDGGINMGAAWVLFLEGDTMPPRILAPHVVVELSAKGTPPSGAIVNFTVGVVDDADPAPSVVCVPPSGSFFPYGKTIVTCTATDAAGNQAVRTFPVVVGPSARPY